MIRIAAVGDIHIGADCDHRLAHGLVGIEERADVLLLAGDLTKCGTPDEAGIVAEELRNVAIPVVAVLGNHDYHDGSEDKVTDILTDAGIRVLEGDSVVLDLTGGRLGVAGVKGFGGGFAGANAAAFGEREMKAFIQHTYEVSQHLADALATLDATECDARVALLHYSPTPETLHGGAARALSLPGQRPARRSDRPSGRRSGDPRARALGLRGGMHPGWHTRPQRGNARAGRRLSRLQPQVRHSLIDRHRVRAIERSIVVARDRHR